MSRMTMTVDLAESDARVGGPQVVAGAFALALAEMGLSGKLSASAFCGLVDAKRIAAAARDELSRLSLPVRVAGRDKGDGTMSFKLRWGQ